MVASECTPYSKTGGLADVVGALPFALQEQGEEVAVVLPLYWTTAAKIPGAQRVYEHLPVALGTATYSVQIKRIVERNVSFYFVDCPALFDRDGLYGAGGQDYPDNHIRFAVFCRAALAVVRYLFRPDVLHLHDWQACLVGPYVQRFFGGDPTYYGVKQLLTIHNLAYAGLFSPDVLPALQLPSQLLTPSYMEFYGKVSLLKGGIVFADFINTVSPTYAREIQEAEQGCGLDGLLRSRSSSLCGILNGVDYSEWSPEKDPFLAVPYDENDLEGKKACKADLLRVFGLPEKALGRPLLGLVSRFVEQKGFDLLEEIAPELVNLNLSMVALGNGEPRYEKFMRELASAYPEQIAVTVAYDNALAHKVEAGSDIFLMPSRYEPCGLNQMYSLRYGTVPIVRATGGLDDTIEESTGFKFRQYSGPALLDALKTALSVYNHPDRWTAMMKAGMAKDFSWTASAAQYRNLYRRITT